MWWAIFALLIGSILAAELVNTAIEELLDHIHPEIHPVIGRAKDLAAGAVLTLSTVAVIIFGLFLCDW